MTQRNHENPGASSGGRRPGDLPGNEASASVKVLLIEDNPADVKLVRNFLGDGDGSTFVIQDAATLSAGLEILGSGGTDIILLDLGLPDSSGFDTIVKVVAKSPQTPIVVLTGLEDESLALQALNHGAQDYLVKGNLDPRHLVRTIHHAIERLRGRHEIQRRTAEYETLLLALSDAGEGLTIVDTVAQRFLFVNDAACRMSGYSREELLALPSFFDLVDPKESAALADILVRRLSGEPVSHNIEATALHREGRQINLEITVQPSTWSNQNQLIVIFHDITERKHAEKELAKARDQALEASRLKSAFLANMSHEVRTPLNILLGYSSLVEEHLRDLHDDSQQELFLAIHRAGRRLMETVHHVLDLSKIETDNFTIEPTRLRVAPVIERVIAELSNAAEEKDISLRCRIDEPEAEILFDEYCLSRAIGDLLENAIKFTQCGEIVAWLHRDAEGILCLEVQDTGIGIDAAFVPRLFEPFSQEEPGYTRRFEGAGLGLALVKKFLDLNGARISVNSEKGVGSTFKIEFLGKSNVDWKLGSYAPARLSAGETTAPSQASHKPAVLVVEDDPDTQTYMKAALDKHYEVLSAVSAEEARKTLDTHPGQIPVILMDLSLKGSEDGISLTRALREQKQWKDVPIIATTAHALPEDRRRALAAGCTDYLAKPFGRNELLSMMDRVLGHA